VPIAAGEQHASLPSQQGRLEPKLHGAAKDLKSEWQRALKLNGGFAAGARGNHFSQSFRDAQRLSSAAAEGSPLERMVRRH
jgi:hypothetical protein